MVSTVKENHMPDIKQLEDRVAQLDQEIVAAEER